LPEMPWFVRMRRFLATPLCESNVTLPDLRTKSP
jgi:hypothetical protein